MSDQEIPVSASEDTPRTPRPPAGPASSPVAQIEANLAQELDSLLNAVSACGEHLASSPEVAAAARLDLLAQAGRVAHAIIDGRRRGVSLRKWISVNPTLRHLEAAVRLLLSPGIDVALELDPGAGAVHLAPGELDLLILNLVLDARSRLEGSGGLVIRSACASGSEETAAIIVADHPRAGSPARSSSVGSQVGFSTVGLITRDAGGEVELGSTPDGGTEVRVQLPARRGFDRSE
jgi:signal transduction histidine kinase